MKILAIVGSPRLKGNTNYLVDQALGEIAKAGVQTEKIVLHQYKINPCLGHDNCGSFESCQQTDDTNWILERFRDADGVILATPVYYYDVSAQMKTFIDRNYFIYTHKLGYKPKVVGIIIIAAEEGIEDTLHTLGMFVNELGVEEDRRFVVSGYADKLGEAKQNLSLVQAAQELGQRMARVLKDLNTQKP
ncbi:MAG: flavodoxin family protein [Dehalococcoidia bacterium]|nr:MAG: flavodoxin family protein [Dehalococcoidia bacterium]